MKTLLALICFSLSFNLLADDYWWVGDFQKTTARGSYNGHYEPCVQSQQNSEKTEFEFTTWDWSRAMVTNVCFQVYGKFITDSETPIPGELYVDVNYQVLGTEDHGVAAARFVRKVGNNYLYALDLKSYAASVYYTYKKNVSYEFSVRPHSAGAGNAEITKFNVNYQLFAQ